MFAFIAVFVSAFIINNTFQIVLTQRVREIGLLRAVGMTRRQLRRAVRWEAAIVATFGGLMGVAVGMVLGVAGLLAAVLPARRAGRMDILEAIAHE